MATFEPSRLLAATHVRASRIADVARVVDPDSSRTRIDALVEVWRDECLAESGSLLFDDRLIWTTANLANINRASEVTGTWIVGSARV